MVCTQIKSACEIQREIKKHRERGRGRDKGDVQHKITMYSFVCQCNSLTDYLVQALV